MQDMGLSSRCFLSLAAAYMCFVCWRGMSLGRSECCTFSRLARSAEQTDHLPEHATTCFTLTMRYC